MSSLAGRTLRSALRYRRFHPLRRATKDAVFGKRRPFEKGWIESFYDWTENRLRPLRSEAVILFFRFVDLLRLRIIVRDTAAGVGLYQFIVHQWPCVLAYVAGAAVLAVVGQHLQHLQIYRCGLPWEVLQNFFGVLYNYFTDAQAEQLKEQTQLAAQGVAKEGKEYLNSLDIEKYRITWIDKDGTVLFDSKANTDEMENHLEREEIKDALKKGVGQSSRYSKTLMEKQRYYAEKISDGSVVRLSVSQYTWWRLAYGMMTPILILIVVSYGLSLYLAYELSNRIVEPLNDLDLDHPEDIDTYDEIKPLIIKIEAQQRLLNRQNKQLLRDISEKEKAEQIRKEFTANVSHELKTPLQSISGCAELLSNGMVKDEDVPQFSQQIYSESKRMTSLVDDIIGLSRLDEGARDMTREKVDLMDISSDVVNRLLPVANNTGVELSIEGEKSEFVGIPSLLNEIVYNLCDNAIKYNKNDGHVSVSVTSDEKKVVLTVSDDGIGIPLEQQERIFERFYRVDKSHSKEVGGTGLWLSIVKHAVSLHNGKIELRSQLGTGTTITVTFPKESIIDD